MSKTLRFFESPPPEPMLGPTLDALAPQAREFPKGPAPGQEFRSTPQTCPPGRDGAPSRPLHDLRPGDSLGAYTLQRLLGEGGMGRVFLAQHDVIGRKVALKVLHNRLAQEPQVVERCFLEAQLVNRIRHPGIVEVTDLFIVDGMPCIVMELLEGDTLTACLRRRASAADAASEGISEAELFDVAIQIAEALQAAHAAGVVHRDLKPDNVLLSPVSGAAGGSRYLVKVLDFGVAQLCEPSAADGSAAACDEGPVMGTPEFMAPEQLTGEPLDPRADIYALGICLYRMFTGKLPFTGDTLRDVVNKQLTALPQPPSELATVTPPLEELIVAMLAKSPAARPQSMLHVAEALRTIAARAHAAPRRRSVRLAASAAVVASLLAVTGVAFLGGAAGGLPPVDLASVARASPPAAALVGPVVLTPAPTPATPLPSVAAASSLDASPPIAAASTATRPPSPASPARDRSATRVSAPARDHLITDAPMARKTAKQSNAARSPLPASAPAAASAQKSALALEPKQPTAAQPAGTRLVSKRDVIDPFAAELR